MQRVEHTRFLRPRMWVAAAVVAALLAAGSLALSPTQGRQAVLDQLQRAATPARTTIASSAMRFVRHASSGYSLAMTLTPNRANGPIAMSVRVLRYGRRLSAAHVRVDFSMPSMHMWNAYTAAPRASAGGHYAATIPVLGMAGDWRLRIVVTPRSGRPFATDVDDRIAA